ncbi:DUF4340 domain-containing protein [Blautia schinkii]|nr:DUF4340 domain-containing protein [Blautia schinkii]
MKKKSIKMAASVAVLAVLCGTYFGVKTYVAKQEEQEEQQEETVTNVISTNESDIKSLKFVIDKKEVTFEKDNDTWVKADEKEFPVNQEKIEEAASALASIDADRVLEDAEDLYEYGLDEPQNTITVTTNDDKQTSIRVGMENESTSQYYVSKDDDKNTVYVVPDTSISPFMDDLYDYAEMEDFPVVESANVSKIQVNGSETSYTLEKEPDDGFWYLRGDTDSEQADTSSVNNLTSALGSMTYDSFANYNCTDLSDYGLKEPYATITVDYEEEAPTAEDENSDETTETETSEIENQTETKSSETGNQDETESAELDDETETESAELGDVNEIENAETGAQTQTESADLDNQSETDNEEEQEPEMVQKQLIISIGDTAEGDSRYVSVNGSNQIYTMSNETLSTFLDKKVSDFWNMTVSYVSVNQLNSMEVNYNNTTHTINVSRETSEDEDGEESEVTTYQMDGKEVDATSFSTFFNKLVNMTGQKRLEEEYKTDKNPEMEASFYTDNNTDITVKYYNYDTNFYAAVVDDKVYLVNKMSVKEMFEAFETLCDAAEQNSTEAEDN